MLARPNRHVLLAAIGLTLLLATATACGGANDAESSADIARPTRAEFLTLANAICRQRNVKFRALSAPTSLDDRTSTLEKALAIDDEELDELRALTPPRPDDQLLKEILDLTQERLELGRQALEAQKNGATPDEAVLQRENELQFEIQAKMIDYGFAGGGPEDECTEAP